MLPCVLAAALLTWGVTARERDVPSAELLELLSIDCPGNGTEFAQLYAAGPRSVRPFQTVLLNPDARRWHVLMIYHVVGATAVDRKTFLPHARRHLAHADGTVRRVAAGFLSQFGTPADSVTLVALLSDPDSDVAYALVHILEETGTDRTVVAMNTWLRVSRDQNENPADPTTFSHYVIAGRDRLRDRLAGQKLLAPGRGDR